MPEDNIMTWIAVIAIMAPIISAVTSIITVNIRLRNAAENKYVTQTNLVDKLEIVQAKLDNIVEHLRRIDIRLNNRRDEK
jgi:hypothetical protein